MNTVDFSLLSLISGFSRGTIFFAEDLEGSGFTPDQIRWALSRIVSDETGVIRLARGMYLWAERSGLPYSGKILMPSPDTVARAYARRWRVRIAPCGAHAASLAGFNALPYGVNTYVSDGADQTINLQNGVTITFKRRVSLKVFQFRSERLRDLTEGMRFLGKEAVSHAEGRGVIADTLLHVSDDDFKHDIMLCPSWMRELLREIRS